MTVVETPKETPTLTVDKFRYSSGEQIQANCTSRASFPAANLTWFVNDQQSDPMYYEPARGVSPTGKRKRKKKWRHTVKLVHSSLDHSAYLNPVPGPAPTIIFPEPGGSLETSRSTLELEADSATFRDTKLTLRCEASLFQLYRRSSEDLELHEDTPQLASVLGPSIADASIRLDVSFSVLVVLLCTLVMMVCR